MRHRFDRTHPTAAGLRPAGAPRDPAREAGFSLLEVIIATTITLVMVGVVTTLAISGAEAQRYAERLSRATEIGQDVITEIKGHLRSSVMLFHNDALGTSYTNVVEITPTATPLSSSRLPELRSTDIFRPEVSGTESGNALLFARHAWTDRYTMPTSGRMHGIDVYRLVGYYLRPEGSGPQAGNAIGLNLCRYVSEPLVDGDQLDELVDPVDLQETLKLLFQGRTTDDTVAQPQPIHPPVQVAWKLGGDLTDVTTLRQISSSTWTLSNTPLPPRASTWRILRDSPRCSDGMLFFRHHSVATNFSPPAFGVARFSTMTTSGAGFPHGFELQLIGPASARQLLIRLSVVSTNRDGRPAYATLEAIQDCRDI